MKWRSKKLWHPRGSINEIPIGSLVKYDYNSERDDGYHIGIVLSVAPLDMWYANENRYSVYWYGSGWVGAPQSIVLEVAKGT